MSAESSDDRVVELLEQLASTDAETAATAFVERDAYDTLEAFVERHDHDFDDGALNRLKTRLRMIRQDTRSFAQEGDKAKAEELFTRCLPLMLFEFQEGIGVGIRKYALQSRGFIENSKVRHPGPNPTDETKEEFHRLVGSTGLATL